MADDVMSGCFGSDGRCGADAAALDGRQLSPAQCAAEAGHADLAAAILQR